MYYILLRVPYVVVNKNEFILSTSGNNTPPVSANLSYIHLVAHAT